MLANMPVHIGFAFLAGLLTLAASCILPAPSGERSWLRSLLIVLGFILAFSAVLLVFSAITDLVGLSAYDLRMIAVAAIDLLDLASQTASPRFPI